MNLLKMSLSSKNSLPIQSSTAPSNPLESTSSRQITTPATNAMRPQKTEQASSVPRGRHGRSSRGTFNRSDVSSSSRVVIERNTQNVEFSTGNQVESVPSSSGVSVQATSGSSGGRSRGRQRPSGSRGGGGKYRQRQQANQLIEGMSDMSGLDVDLAESIVPTGSSNDSSKVRHATNSRKVNITHLLNYKFDRSKQRGGGSYKRPNPVSHYRDPGTVHKFSKQQFLQANCQFVVLDGHDYTVHKVDPDWPVDWDCIEEVRFKQSASTETTCPICLEPPVAAKITRCGHIYCWTCMLHYLSLSDENCRQCPICFEFVYKGDLRSVVSFSFISYSPGEEICMRLMIRKKGCVEVEPYKNTNDDHYWYQANLVIVDPKTVVTQIARRERDELLVKLNFDKDEPEVCFIEQALDWLQKRVDKLHCWNPKEHKDVLNLQDTTTNESKSYLFYQCLDNQHIYLNPFSTKILCHEYKDLENCPAEIHAKILQMDWISMSEAWRKRFKYLEHLPLTCEFRLIEIDFRESNLISKETYRVFEEQIKKREEEREKRRREERKREKIIQVEQNRRIYGIQPSLKINLDNTDQFPSVSDERYLGISQPRGNQLRVDQDYSTTDDEFESDTMPTLPTTLSTVVNGEQFVRIAPTDITSLDGNKVTEVTSSFRDIQLQEAAKASQSSKNNNPTTSGWASKSQSKSNDNSQSSFAQLLVNVKTSSKDWTKNVSSSTVKSAQPGVSTSSRAKTGPDSDEGIEELRALPGDFTISDFIDMNVVSNTGKKKGKYKSSFTKT